MSSSSFDFQYSPLGDVSFNPSIYDRWPSTSVYSNSTSTNDLGLSTTCDPRDGCLTSSHAGQHSVRGPRWSNLPASGLQSSQSAPFTHSQSHLFEFSSPPWDTLLPSYNKSDDVNELMYPRIQVPQLKFPPSPSSSADTENSTSPSPHLSQTSVHVVCNAPIVAPIPLPYHSPTFLQFEQLPDCDEDLSHPPYTRRPAQKRKYDIIDGGDDSAVIVAQKRLRSSDTHSNSLTWVSPNIRHSRSRHIPSISGRTSLPLHGFTRR